MLTFFTKGEKKTEILSIGFIEDENNWMKKNINLLSPIHLLAIVTARSKNKTSISSTTET